MNIDDQAGMVPAESSLALVRSPGEPGGPSRRVVATVATCSGYMPGWMVAFGGVAFAASVAALTILDLAFSSQRWIMGDLQVYRWAGLVVRHSGDLYGGHFPYHHLRFTYSPMAGLIFAALSVISITALKWLVTVLSIACLVVTLWLTWGALGYRRSAGRIGAALAAAGIALWLQPVQDTLVWGQVNLVLMLIIVADLRLSDHAWLKGAGVGLAAGFKLTPLIFVVYMVLTRRFRAAGVSLATFALTIAGSLILLPRQARQFWLGGLFLDSYRTGNNAYVSNQSLHGALARLLGGVTAAQPYWLASAVIVGGAGLLLAAWAARRGHEMIGILTCALTGLLISPVSWSHHWVWIAPALVVVADLAARIRAPATTQPGHGTGRAARWRRWPGLRRWEAWAAVAALAAPFFVLPEVLVPAAVVQGKGAHGVQLLIGNLYVIAGLAVLCLAGFVLITRSETSISSRPRSKRRSPCY